MRQAIGSTWILQLVIIFMLIFISFLSLSISFTKAFKTKNELVTIVEKYEGVSESQNGALTIINNYLLYNGYSTFGNCDDGDYGASSLDNPALEKVTSTNINTKYLYCVRKLDTSTDSLKHRAQYRIRIFYKFSLPIIGNIYTFSVNGTTIDITHSISDIDAVES